MAEQFTVKDRQVDIDIRLHKYNGVHFNGMIHFKGHVNFVNDFRLAFGDAIVEITDHKEMK